MDRLESMAILIVAAEAGSLSAASRRLGTPLTTVSRKISDLERRLGTRLLTRSSRQLALTEAGRSFVAASKRILDDVEEAERAASGEYTAPRGDLTITAPVVFGRLHVLPVVTEFLETYPEIDIRFVLVDRVINLFEEHVDLAVRIGALPDSSLTATRVGAIRRVACASPSYFAARGTPQVPGELSAHDCINFETMTEPTSWRFAIKGADVSVPIHSRLIVNTAEAAVDAAVAGLGITRVLSYQAAAALREGTLAVILRSFEPVPWPVSLVYGGAPLLPLKLRAFLDFAAPRLKTRIAESEVAR
jgi:DNA-binding transcriptional LysR family regulator